MTSFKVSLFSFCLLLLIITCKRTDTNSDNSTRTQIKNDLSEIGINNISDSTAQILEEWRTDSLGCLRLRAKNKTEFLVTSLKLRGRSKPHLIQILGNPNFPELKDIYTPLRDEDNFNVLRYYFDTFCYNNTVVDSLDNCWVDFLISSESNVLVNVLYVCE